MKEKRLDYRRVAFIGGGNMTAAIAGGLLEDGYKPGHIAIAEPLDARRDRLQRALPGVFVSADNDEVTARSGSIVLAVKPQIIAAVCLALADTVQQHNPLIVSIAAGPRIDDIDGWLGGGNSVVRVMPNQPALIRRGVSGLFANAATTSAQRNAATAILSAVGPVVAVDSEADIDAVTAVSGSGPAYVYLLIEMLAAAGVQLGLSAQAAERLARETARGAAALAHTSSESMDVLIERVRSPGGTTAAALDSLEDQDVRAIFTRALTAARDRAAELADRAHESGRNFS